jgi:hypothetical protein
VQEWFNSKVEGLLSVGKTIWALVTGQLGFAEIGKMAWEAIKEMIPPTLIRILVEKLVAMIVPAAGALLAIIEGLQAAWGTVSRIIAAIDTFIAFLKAVKSGGAGPKFAQALVAAMIVVLDFVANYLLMKLGSGLRALAGKLKGIARHLMKKKRAAKAKGKRRAKGRAKRRPKRTARPRPRGARRPQRGPSGGRRRRPGVPPRGPTRRGGFFPPLQIPDGEFGGRATFQIGEDGKRESHTVLSKPGADGNVVVRSAEVGALAFIAKLRSDPKYKDSKPALNRAKQAASAAKKAAAQLDAAKKNQPKFPRTKAGKAARDKHKAKLAKLDNSVERNVRLLRNELDALGVGPTEKYDRLKHYGRTPTDADRKWFLANDRRAQDLDKKKQRGKTKQPGEIENWVLDHDPPLVQRYYHGDPARSEKPGYKMTPGERRRSGSDRDRMAPQPIEESRQQGGKMKQESRTLAEDAGLDWD